MHGSVIWHTPKCSPSVVDWWVAASSNNVLPTGLCIGTFIASCSKWDSFPAQGAIGVWICSTMITKINFQYPIIIKYMMCILWNLPLAAIICWSILSIACCWMLSLAQVCCDSTHSSAHHFLFPSWVWALPSSFDCGKSATSQRCYRPYSYMYKKSDWRSLALQFQTILHLLYLLSTVPSSDTQLMCMQRFPATAVLWTVYIRTYRAEGLAPGLAQSMRTITTMMSA